jgi:hypothetical protein
MPSVQPAGAPPGEPARKLAAAAAAAAAAAVAHANGNGAAPEAPRRGQPFVIGVAGAIPGCKRPPRARGRRRPPRPQPPAGH